MQLRNEWPCRPVVREWWGVVSPDPRIWRVEENTPGRHSILRGPAFRARSCSRIRVSALMAAPCCQSTCDHLVRRPRAPPASMPVDFGVTRAVSRWPPLRINPDILKRMRIKRVCGQSLDVRLLKINPRVEEQRNHWHGFEQTSFATGQPFEASNAIQGGVGLRERRVKISRRPARAVVGRSFNKLLEERIRVDVVWPIASFGDSGIIQVDDVLQPYPEL